MFRKRVPYDGAFAPIAPGAPVLVPEVESAKQEGKPAAEGRQGRRAARFRLFPGIFKKRVPFNDSFAPIAPGAPVLVPEAESAKQEGESAAEGRQWRRAARFRLFPWIFKKRLPFEDAFAPIAPGAPVLVPEEEPGVEGRKEGAAERGRSRRGLFFNKRIPFDGAFAPIAPGAPVLLPEVPREPGAEGSEDDGDAGWEFTEGPSLARQWSRGWRLLLVMAVMVGAYGKWRGGRDYQGFKAWRARTLTAQAIQAMAGGLPEKASALLDQAAILAPREAVVMRAMADFCESRRDIMAVYALRQLVKIGASDEADRERICRLALDWGHPELILPEVLKEWEQADVKGLSLVQLRLSALWMVSRGLNREGEARLRLALQQAAGTAEVASLEVALGRMIMNAASATGMAESAAAEALRLLSGVAYSPTAEARLRAEATRLLAGLLLHPSRIQLLTPVRAELLCGAFRELAEAEQDVAAAAGYELAAVSVELAAFPERKEALVRALVEKSATSSLEQRLAAARWFNEHGLPKQALDICLNSPEEQVKVPWFTARIDALFALREFDRARAALQFADDPLPEHLRRLFLYRIERESRPNVDALAAMRVELEQAVAKASSQEALSAAENLERSGDTETALSIYNGRKNDPSAGLGARLGMVRCLDVLADRTLDLVKALEGVLQLWPQSDQARSDLAYLRLLEGDPDADDVPAVLRLQKQTPWFLAFRVAAALAHLHENRPGEALVLLERNEVPWEKVRPGWQAVYAAVLDANGRKEEAREVALRVAKAPLRPGELRLIEKLIK